MSRTKAKVNLNVVPFKRLGGVGEARLYNGASRQHRVVAPEHPGWNRLAENERGVVRSEIEGVSRRQKSR